MVSLCSLITAAYNLGTGNTYPITCHEGTEVEYRHGSILSLTLALDGGVWLIPRPSCFTPGRMT